eukprot:scaffold28624_cov31-Tisochrysis_lutea.AAC.1
MPADGAFRLLSSLGATVGSLSINVSPTAGRGVFTTAAVANGETLLRVPKRLALATPEIAWASERISAVNDAVGLHEHEAMACALLERCDGGADETGRHACQATRKCTRLLPSIFVPGPAWIWSDEHLELLASPPLKARCRARRASVQRLSENIHRLWHRRPPSTCVSRAAPSYGSLAWAVAAVTSRAMVAATSNGRRFTALVPGCDLLNHDATSAVTFMIDDESDEYIIRAAADLPVGAEVTFCYATASKAFMLEQYGFFVDEEASNCDSVEIDVGNFLASNGDAVAACVKLGLLETASIEVGHANGSKCLARRYQPAGIRLREAVLQVLMHKNGMQNLEAATVPTAEQRVRVAAIEQEWRHTYCGMLRDALSNLEAADEIDLCADSSGHGASISEQRMYAAEDEPIAPFFESSRAVPTALDIAIRRQAMARNFRASQRSALLREADDSGVATLL